MMASRTSSSSGGHWEGNSTEMHTTAASPPLTVAVSGDTVIFGNAAAVVPGVVFSVAVVPAAVVVARVAGAAVVACVVGAAVVNCVIGAAVVACVADAAVVACVTGAAVVACVAGAAVVACVAGVAVVAAAVSCVAVVSGVVIIVAGAMSGVAKFVVVWLDVAMELGVVTASVTTTSKIVTTVRALLKVTSLVPEKMTAKVSDILSPSLFRTVAIPMHCSRLAAVSIRTEGYPGEISAASAGKSHGKTDQLRCCNGALPYLQ